MGERVTLSATGLVLREGAEPFDESVAPGEIVGLAGLDGHGQAHYLETLAGLRPPAAGLISATQENGTRVVINSFRRAVATGIAYLPRDRRKTGIFPTLSVLDNFSISTAKRDRRTGLISRDRQRARYEGFRQQLSIVAPRPEAPITSLSGGNQQKVLLARQLAFDPAILLLDDPTRGVDVATRRTLYGVFRELAAGGMAVVVLSSEIEEILALCHRTVVFRDHAVAERLQGEAMRADRVIAAMFGRAAA